MSKLSWAREGLRCALAMRSYGVLPRPAQTFKPVFRAHGTNGKDSVGFDDARRARASVGARRARASNF